MPEEQTMHPTPIMSATMARALQDLYTDALKETRGRELRRKIRRIARRFLTKDQIAEAEDEAHLTA